jgi:hypothetical protein
MLKHKLKYLLPVAVLACSGCATMFGDNDKMVAVTSVPAGASVAINHMDMATATPNSFIVLTNQPTVITLQKKGYEPKNILIDPQFQNVGLWNILFWPGFLVDWASGSMMKIPADQRTLKVNLVPLNSK